MPVGRPPTTRDVYRIRANGVGLVQLTNTPDRFEVWTGLVAGRHEDRVPRLSGALGGSDCGICTINRGGSG